MHVLFKFYKLVMLVHIAQMIILVHTHATVSYYYTEQYCNNNYLSLI